MSHLTPAEFVELLDGQLADVRRGHIRDCSRCREEFAALHEALDRARDDSAEPPPLFWDQFGAQVRDRIAADGVRPRRFEPWLHSPARVALAAAAALVLIVAAGRVLTPGGILPAPQNSDATHVAPEDAEAEAAWAVVQAAAEDAGWEGVREAGVSTRPGQTDGALLQLNDDERQHLLRLLDEELKRAGV